MLPVDEGVGCAGGNAYGIANRYRKIVFAQAHAAFSGGDVIYLLALMMPVQQGGAPGWQDGLGQALFAVTIGFGMHQFTYDRAILSDERRHVLVRRMESIAHSPLRYGTLRHRVSKP